MIHTDIKNSIKEAMLAKDAVRLQVLRSLVAAFTNELVAKRRKPDEVLGDEEALEVIRRQVKQRKDSIEQFEKGNRPDLAEVEKAELVVLDTLLPAQMPYEEVLKFIKLKVEKEGPVDKSKAGQFMGSVMKDLKGKADGAEVKKAIDTLFA